MEVDGFYRYILVFGADGGQVERGALGRVGGDRSERWCMDRPGQADEGQPPAPGPAVWACDCHCRLIFIQGGVWTPQARLRASPEVASISRGCIFGRRDGHSPQQWFGEKL